MEISEINRIYDEIDTYSIELEADPTTLGPRYLNDVISRCRNYLNRSTTILLRIRREKQFKANDLAAAEAILKIESDNLLANDERVQRLPSIKDREAYISTHLRESVAKITILKGDLRNLDAIEGAVKMRHNELVRTDGQIKTQRSLIRDELDTKSFYGDEGDDSSRHSDLDEKALDLIMNGSSDSEEEAAPVLIEGLEELFDIATAKIKASPITEASVEEPVEEVVLTEDDTPEDFTGVELAASPTPESTPLKIEEVKASPLTDDEALASFLSDEPSPVVVDSQLALKPVPPPKKPRKANPKEEVVQPAPVSDEPDFSDILASF